MPHFDATHGPEIANAIMSAMLPMFSITSPPAFFSDGLATCIPTYVPVRLTSITRRKISGDTVSTAPFSQAFQHC
jgi:hypothetical protein